MNEYLDMDLLEFCDISNYFYQKKRFRRTSYN